MTHDAHGTTTRFKVHAPYIALPITKSMHAITDIRSSSTATVKRGTPNVGVTSEQFGNANGSGYDFSELSVSNGDAYGSLCFKHYFTTGALQVTSVLHKSRTAP